MDYDAIVIGSGPSGSTAAMYLGQAGKKVLVVDKAGFPRDKICGDAQGRKAEGIMRELGIAEGYRALPGHPVYGITAPVPWLFSRNECPVGYKVLKQVYSIVQNQLLCHPF